MQLSRRTRRSIFYSTLLSLVAATVWWAWPQPSISQPVAPPIGQAIEASAIGVDETAKPQQVEPRAAEAVPQAEQKQAEPVPKVRVYQVVEGDTVETIAARFGLQPSSVLWSNGIDEDSLLQIDQEVMIPSSDGIVYAVADGDTFWDIATTYGVDMDEIIRANADISPDTFRPGDQLVIPGGVPPRRSAMLASRSGSERDRISAAPQALPQRELGTRLGDLIWPLAGQLTEYFGWRTHPVYGTKNYHEGIDIGVPSGTPIRAIAAGRVVMAEWYGGYGLTIKVDHGNGLLARYSHDSELLVGVGEYVEAGETIAYSGNTGVSTGPHLDFGLYQDGVAVNPLDLLP